MTVFEQSHTWDELIRHFVDSYVVETDKKAVSSFYDRGYIAKRLKGLETELALECRINLTEWRRTMGPQCGHTWRNRGFRICHDFSA